MEIDKEIKAEDLKKADKVAKEAIVEADTS